MSGLFRSKKAPIAQAAPAYTGLQLQTSSNAMPCAIVWGTQKIAPNLLWYDGFRAIAHHTQQETGGGKGGGGSTTTSTSYTYAVSILLGICEGPISNITRVWQAKTITTLAAVGFELFEGTDPQSAWGFMVTNYPTKALQYNQIAYVAASSYQLGDSANLPNHNFEVVGIFAGTMADVGLNDDADMALVIEDFLSNDQYGAFFPFVNIDQVSLFGGTGSSTYQAYCKAMGFGMSPAITSQEAASSVLERWLELTNTAPVWSGDLLKFKPYADADVVGFGGFTYIAAVAPIYNLTDEDFVSSGDEDPVICMRSDPADAYNITTLEIFDRSNSYAATPIPAREESAIQLFGTRPESTFIAHEMCLPEAAALSAQLKLQRGLYIRAAYQFRLSWEYVLLEPMDVVTITDEELGLDEYSVRIVSIEEDDAGELTVIAEEFPQGVGSATLYPKQSGDPTVPNPGEPADPINPPIIFEPPAILTNGVLQVRAAISGGVANVADPIWGGADIWLSTDNVSYVKQVQRITAPARMGIITAILNPPVGSNPDMVSVLSVDLRRSGGELVSVSAADAAAGLSLCYVDGELLSYTTATLTGPNQYDLTGLYRGLYGTDTDPHAVGTDFARVDSAVFEFDYPAGYVGQTIYMKFPSFNVWGLGAQSIDLAVAYTFAPTGSSGGIMTNPMFLTLQNGGDIDLGDASTPVTFGGDLGLAGSVSSGTIDLGVAGV